MKKTFKGFLVLGAALMLGLAACENGTTPVAVESMTLNHTSYELEVGDTLQLEATITPSNATNKNVTWSVVSGQEHATITDGGLVVGISVGDAMILAVTQDGGKSATCNIAVVEEGTVESEDPTPGESEDPTPGESEDPTPGESEEPSKPIPAVTTPKATTTVHPNFNYTFTMNAETGNWNSQEYLANIVDLDPTGYTDICQIEFVIFMDFDGQNSATQYYGGEFGVGSDGFTHIREQFSDASGHWQYDLADENGGAYRKGTLHLIFDVENIVDSDQLYLIFTYAAKQTFTVTLKTINFYHTEGYELSSQTVQVNKQLIKNTASTGEVIFALNSLTSTNPFSYFDLNLSYTGLEDYTGGVIFVEGVYAEGLILPNNPNNSVNIGFPMGKGANVTTEASVRVYLPNYCAVDTTGHIKFLCGWAPASDLTLKSVTFYQLSGTAAQPEDIILDDSFLSETQSPLEEKLGMDNIKVAMSRSLVNEGNNYLLKKAAQKMARGDETTIAYIGGSITQGDNMNNPGDKITDIPGSNYSASWAYWSYKYLAGKYGTGSNVKYHNAGMNGTGSEVGVARFQTDILDFAPSIVFIEFAVNNGDTVLEKETYELDIIEEQVRRDSLKSRFDNLRKN